MNDNPLLDAVDGLTKPQKTANWEHSHEHTWKVSEFSEEEFCIYCEELRDDASDESVKQLKRRTDEPLLDQLAGAIRSSVGAGSGGGNQPQTRTPMDVSAFALYEDIDGRIRAWLDDLGARPGKDLTSTQNLRSWYVLWNAQQHTEASEDRYAGILEGWAQSIIDKLDPPKKVEITAKCPVCNQEWMNIGLKLDDGSDDPNDLERVHVLNAVERETLEESYALCAACNTVWKGVLAMRQLRIAIDDSEADDTPKIVA